MPDRIRQISKHILNVEQGSVYPALYRLGSQGRLLRIALGATVADLLRLIMARGLTLTALGILVGGIVTALAAQFIATMLYKVSPTDPTAFGATVLVMLAVGATACFLPARRASRLDAVRALRV
jgi:ABC-type antimicrobial peptide transport system permease subunit